MNVKKGLDPSELLNLIERLRKLRAEHAVLIEGSKAAEAELARAQGEAATIRGAIASRELDLAKTSAPVSDEPFEEDRLLAISERRVRVATARLRLCKEAVSVSDSRIGCLAVEIQEAWLKLGRHGYAAQLDVFRDAAAALRSAHGDLFAWIAVFSNLDKQYFRTADPLAVANPKPTSTRDMFLIEAGEAHEEKNWSRQARDLRDSLVALRSLMQNALDRTAETVEQVEA
jgi:hypothetical protein